MTTTTAKRRTKPTENSPKTGGNALGHGLAHVQLLAEKLAAVEVEVTIRDVAAWTEEQRAQVNHWVGNVDRPGIHQMLPDVLRGKLPQGWGSPSSVARRRSSSPVGGQIDPELRDALRDGMIARLFGEALPGAKEWAKEARTDGIGDMELRTAIIGLLPAGEHGAPFGNTYQLGAVDMPPACWQVAGYLPMLWFGQSRPEGTPHVEGDDLIARVRTVLQLPYPADSPAPAGPQPSALDPEPAVQHGVEIALDLIDESTTNTRTDFGDQEGDTKFQELVDSVKRFGLLQELTVIPKPDGRYETRGGSRRLRACRAAGKTTATCCVRRMDAATAVEVELDENEIRKELNPIERAHAYRQVMLARGLTQQQLAEERGLVQETISVLVGLLDFPDEWQQRVLRGELTTTHMRLLAPIKDRPKLLAAVADHLMRAKRDGEGVPSTRRFGQFIQFGVRSATCSMAPAKYKSDYTDDRMFKLTPKLREQLDVITFREGTQTTERACNVHVWHAEQKKAVAAWKQAQAKRQGTGEGGTRGAGDSGKSETDKAQDRARILHQRLYEHKFAWLQRAIADRIDAAPLPLVLRLLLGYSQPSSLGLHDRGQILLACATQAGGKPGDPYGPCVERALGTLPLNRTEAVARTALAGWIALPRQRAELSAEQVTSLAAELSVDFAAEWVPGREFLELHTLDQLGELVQEWKIGASCPSKKRGQLIEDILYAAATKKGLPCPKALAKLDLTKG